MLRVLNNILAIASFEITYRYIISWLICRFNFSIKNVCSHLHRSSPLDLQAEPHVATRASYVRGIRQSERARSHQRTHLQTTHVPHPSLFLPLLRSIIAERYSSLNYLFLLKIIRYHICFYTAKICYLNLLTLLKIKKWRTTWFYRLYISICNFRTPHSWYLIFL